MSKIKKTPVRPPIRYPGGKARKCRILSDLFPDYTGDFYEPFVGAGSISIYQQETKPSKQIHINDIYRPLYNFWLQLKNDGDRLVRYALKIRKGFKAKNIQVAKVLYQSMLERMHDKDATDLDKAVGFFVLNKISFSGVGGLSKIAYQKTFNESNIKKLTEISRIIEGFTISNKHYKAALKNVGKEDFLFLDPPYDIKDFLYGDKGSTHRGFDHERFFEFIKELPCKWLITYNDNKKLRDWWQDFNIQEEQYLYCMSFKKEGDRLKSRPTQELIIKNY